MRLHIRNGKGRKNRYVTRPNAALLALRRYWASHRNPQFIFSSGKTDEERKVATPPMDRSGL